MLRSEDVEVSGRSDLVNVKGLETREGQKRLCWERRTSYYKDHIGATD